VGSSDSEWLPRTGRACTWGRSCRARSGSGEGFEKKSSLYVLELYPYTIQPHPESAPNAAPRAMVRIANLSLNGGSTYLLAVNKSPLSSLPTRRVREDLRHHRRRRCVLERCGERHSCITLDSCGKADDPHNLEGGALAARAGHISRRSAVAPSTHAGTLLLERLATARRTPSTLAEYARAASAGDATDMPARLVRCSNSVLTVDVV